MVTMTRIKTYFSTHGASVALPLLGYYLSNIFTMLTQRLYNSKKVECNYCGYLGNKFYAFHSSGETWYNTKCPRCGSLPRYRLLLEYLKNQPNFLSKQVRLLDIAPIKVFKNFCFSQKNIKYISTDISSPLADLKMDITKLAFRDNAFDIIICYHVLEHVKDDVAGLSEFFRVLKPDGFAIIQVPINQNLFGTIEYDKPNPKESGHVRMYGADYKERLEKAGFIIKKDDYSRRVTEVFAHRYGLADEEIYFLTKPQK